MSPILIIIILLSYFVIIFIISRITSRNSDNNSFFIGDKKSPWFVVAFGMIGASLSGVTFISVPGWVVSSQFSYFQMVLGYLLGYFVIANVLMPIYYRLNLISIYTYLERRFGLYTYKTGAFYFILSRLIGAAFRLYLVANVLQITVFEPLGIKIPFYITVTITVLLIWVYTFKGGIKTIIWTDTLQTLFMLIAVGVSIWFVSKSLNLELKGIYETVRNSNFSKTFFFDNPKEKSYFFKQFFSGAFIAIVMTGLDQDMMQKNLSCKNIKEAKKNMFWFSIILIFVNLMFLSLGLLLLEFSTKNGLIEITQNGLLMKDFDSGKMIARQTDDLFPLLATQGFLLPVVGIFFVLGLVASAYSSADSALTALATSFSIDFMNADKIKNKNKTEKIRKYSHIMFSLLLIALIVIFKLVNKGAVIKEIFIYAGYTYGSLLGLYAFGLFTKFKIRDKIVPFFALISPILAYLININSEKLFNGYKIGFELLIINGLIMFLSLFLLIKNVKFKKHLS